MKKQYILLLLIPAILFMPACSVNKDADFVSMKNVNITKLTAQQIIIDADAVYYNPNDVGCKLVKTDVDVSVDDILVGQVVQTENSEIGAKSNFTIPLKISFATKKILKDKVKILQGVVALLENRKVDVRYEGTVTIDILGVEYESDFDYTEAIPLRAKN